MRLKKHICIAGLLVVACLFTLAVSNNTDSDCVVVVEPGESIQAAIDQAPPGAVICLSRGTWATNLEITKPLTIRGAGAANTILKGPSRSLPTISICCQEKDSSLQVEVSDLSIQGNYEGIVITGSAKAEITRCNVSKNYWGGITVVDNAQATITDCTIANHYDTGIGLAGTAKASIVDCEIMDSHWGIFLNQSACTMIFRTTVQRNEWGIWAMADSCGVVHASDISGNRVDGIRLQESARLDLVDNRITDNHYYGIALQDACYESPTSSFTGEILGSDNSIPGPDELGSNQKGALCPAYPGDPWPDEFLKE